MVVVTLDLILSLSLLPEVIVLFSIDNFSRSNNSVLSDICRATNLPQVQNVEIDLCDFDMVSSFLRLLNHVSL